MIPDDGYGFPGVNPGCISVTFRDIDVSFYYSSSGDGLGCGLGYGSMYGDGCGYGNDDVVYGLGSSVYLGGDGSGIGMYTFILASGDSTDFKSVVMWAALIGERS